MVTVMIVTSHDDATLSSENAHEGNDESLVRAEKLYIQKYNYTECRCFIDGVRDTQCRLVENFDVGVYVMSR